MAFDWSLPILPQQSLEASLLEPGIVRAIALDQIGNRDMADQEFRWATKRAEPGREYEFLDVAAVLNLAGTQATLARAADRQGHTILPALYPIPDWEPEDGFRLDRALIYAVMRQESNFVQTARSWAGARGVMQLMPATASYVARDRSLRGWRVNTLYEPRFNMRLGQQYLEYLMEKDTTSGNLFLTIAAYNAGPGNVARWLRSVDHRGDWLFFLESIPIHETRNYVERVMANLWIYRARLGQRAPSLAQLARDSLPTYASLDTPARENANVGSSSGR